MLDRSRGGCPGRAPSDPFSSRGLLLGAQIGSALQSPNTPSPYYGCQFDPARGAADRAVQEVARVPGRRVPGADAGVGGDRGAAAGAGAAVLDQLRRRLARCASRPSHHTFGASVRARRSGHYDGLRRVRRPLPTVLLSFEDEGISVATGWSDSYYDAFVTRARSNVLTYLIVVPAIVDLAARDWRRIRGPALSKEPRWPCCCSSPAASPSRDRRIQAFAVLYLPLLLLLWAAFRFGPAGIGWAGLNVSMVASWNAFNGRGPFSSLSPLEEVDSLQLFLLASTLPLLCLSA